MCYEVANKENSMDAQDIRDGALNSSTRATTRELASLDKKDHLSEVDDENSHKKDR